MKNENMMKATEIKKDDHIKSEGKDIKVASFVNRSANVYRRERERKEAIRQVRREAQIRRMRKKAMIRNRIVAMVLLMFAVIGVFSTIQGCGNYVSAKIDELPKQVEAPMGYTKTYGDYTISYGETLDGIVSKIMAEENLSDSYRFQDLKKEIMELNPKTIRNANCIKMGKVIYYPYFVPSLKAERQ